MISCAGCPIELSNFITHRIHHLDLESNQLRSGRHLFQGVDFLYLALALSESSYLDLASSLKASYCGI